MKIQRNLISTVLGIFTLILFNISLAGAESGIKNRQVFVGTSARALGMGGAFTAGPASSDSLFWNPSSLGLLETTELSLVGLPFPVSANNREGAFSLGLNPQQLGIVSRDVGNFSLSSWFEGWGMTPKRIEWYWWDMGLPWGKASLPVQTCVTTVTEAPLALGMLGALTSAFASCVNWNVLGRKSRLAWLLKTSLDISGRTPNA